MSNPIFEVIPVETSNQAIDTLELSKARREKPISQELQSFHALFYSVDMF